MKINIISEFKKKSKAFKITAAVAAVVIVVLTAILYILNPNIPASSISFKNETIYLQPGMTIKLNPEVAPYNVTEANLLYRCSDSDIATVSNSTVTAIKEGEVLVYCVDKTNNLKSNVITIKIVEDISTLIKDSTPEKADVLVPAKDSVAPEKDDMSAQINDDAPQRTNNSEPESEIKSEPESKAESAIYVYCSPTGKKYHTESCKSSGKNPQKVLLAAALEEGLTPCSKCKP